MRPSSLHLIDRDERARSLSGVSVDLENYISDAYESLADIETQRVLRALRHGVTLAGVQATIRASEWSTGISPENAVPFQSKIWRTTVMQSGAAKIDTDPYRVSGARTTASVISIEDLQIADEVFATFPQVEQGSGTLIKKGETPSMAEVLIENTRPLNVRYERETKEIIGEGDDADHDGMIWIPEQRFESPVVKQNFSNSHSVSLPDLGAEYPPPHLFYLTRLLETASQNGARPNQLFWAAQAAYGAPFAYAPGTIQSYTSGGVSEHVKFALIKTEDGEEVASFLPVGADTNHGDLKATGTEVEKYEPLTEGGNESSFSSGVNRGFEAPIAVNSTDRISDTITLSTSSHDLSAGDRASLRVLNQEYSKFVVVESVSGADVTVRGELGSVSDSDWAYLSPVSTTASGGGTATLSVSTPYADGDLSVVKDVIGRISPPTISYSVSAA